MLTFVLKYAKIFNGDYMAWKGPLKTKREIELELHKENREDILLNRINKGYNTERNGKRMNNTFHKNLQNTGYMSQENVKDFQKDLVAHCFGKTAKRKQGRGTFFDTREELEEWIADYFICLADHEMIPTVSSLACWLKCDARTIQNHAENPNSEFYEPCKEALAICHAVLEGGATESKLNSVAYIFQAKNYFGMKDQQEITVGTNIGNNQINSEDTLKALKEQKQKEALASVDVNVKEANYQEISKQPELLAEKVAVDNVGVLKSQTE